jgi:hypothetical protein
VSVGLISHRKVLALLCLKLNSLAFQLVLGPLFGFEKTLIPSHCGLLPDEGKENTAKF